jgi:transmembrane sensor
MIVSFDMPTPRLEYLLLLFAQQAANPVERAELMALIANPASDLKLRALIGRLMEEAGPEVELPSETSRAILETILRTPLPAERPSVILDMPGRRPVRWWRYVAAAGCLCLVGTGAWFKLHRRPTPAVNIAVVNDLAPGGNKAILTLYGGQQIVLDSARTGTLAQQGNTRIVKTESGQLAYKPTTEKLNAVLYNTLATPRGGQYELTLSDGTRVWLNAASSITYPTAFTGEQRKVSMTGEAYFEVAENRSKPFTVNINDQTTVDVLGTHFNINAYTEEPELKTSLLEGAIKLHFISRSVLLRPGEQASIDQASAGTGSGEKININANADMEEVMAWKNGVFSFTNAKLPTVMRQLERWYNVTVTYDGPIPGGEFTGEIGRGLTLHQVLMGLASTRVHYSIEAGNKLVIRP